MRRRGRKFILFPLQSRRTLRLCGSFVFDCLEGPVTDGLREGIGQVPFVDHHVHAPEKRAEPIGLDDFRRPFTEASIPAIWQENIPTLIGYRWMVRELARLHDCAPTE